MNGKADLRREKEVFEQAMDLPTAEERQQFVRQACGEDVRLLARVQELLLAHAQSQGFLTEGESVPTSQATMGGRTDRRLAGIGQPVPAEPAPALVRGVVTEKVGDCLGRYKLLEKIGEGGCGVVYLAEQLEPVRRRVALKVVKLGMDTRQVIARFEAERQALAVMDHPNIAKVLDAGATDTGRPYFVMELVRGVRITQFCDERRLSLRERLDLFLQVCQAIQHAHQKGIIHRDIKPANILVTLNDGVPLPKVIDFGIAKATQAYMTDRTLFTIFEQFLGTPTYMSPEQAEVKGMDIDTRSDIYSLGVVLYELLTGRTPFDGKALLERGIEELILTLREVEPPRPSARVSAMPPEELETVAWSQRCDALKIAHRLKGDLDWIVMKCLEKDRTRRYDTANGLAMDLRRFLANEPIIARPPSAVYRLQKAFRKNRLSFTASGLVLLALAVGVGAVIFIQHRAAQGYRQRFYAYQMGRAAAAVTAGQFENLERALAEAPAEYRNWEWQYLNSQVTRWSWHTLFKLDQPVRKLLASRDGGLAALMSGGQHGKVEIVQLPSGRRLATIEMQTSMWAPMRLSADGSMLAGIPDEDRQTLQVWNTRSGELLKSFRLESAVVCIAFSGDSRWLAAGGGLSTVRCWEIETGSARQPGIGISEATALAFSPGGEELSVGTRTGKIYLVPVASGKPSVDFNVGPDEVTALAYSPDATRLVSSQEDHSHQRGLIKLWRLADGSSKDLGEAQAGGVQFSPDGRLILSGGATFWDGSTGELLGRLRLDDVNYGLATSFYPNGGVLSAVASGAVVLATPDRPASERLLGHGRSLRVVRFSPDGRTAASAGIGGEVRLWDVIGAREWKSYGGDSGGVAALAWSPDGRNLVSGSFAEGLHCWDPATLRLRWANSMKTIQAGTAWWLEFNPDGSRILSSSENGVIGIWDARTGASLSRLATTNSSSVMDGVTWSPDGSCVAGLFKDRIVLWKIDGWKERWSVPAEADRCIRFSGDGRSLAYGNYDGSVRLLDSSTGRLVRSFDRHQASVKSVVFSLDGLRLFSGGADGTVRVWDTLTGDELLRLDVIGNRPVWSIDLTRDGSTLAAADSDGVVTLWKTGSTPRSRGR